MVRRREKLPRVYELVIGTVKQIYDHGAFVELDEYGGLEAYVPLNEISHTWFRGIREVLKIGQKKVFKVIRVNRAKKLVDVSLRKVSDSERREKMIEWKRAQRAEKILELAAQRLGKTLDEAYEEAGWKIEDYFGEIYRGLEEAHLRGPDALIEAGVPEDWAKVLADIAKTNIRIPKAKISGIFVVQCIGKDGLLKLKKVLTGWEKKVRVPDNVTIRFYTMGAPKYKLDIEALNYKAAEKVLKEILKVTENMAKKEGCSYSFQRIKK